MKFLIVTDLEGVAGVDSFTQTRTHDLAILKPAIAELAREVNACVAGIHDAAPNAEVDVWEGHDCQGHLKPLLEKCGHFPPAPKRNDLRGYSGLLFVGQHAMAGTVNAPLCHTYNSRKKMYYRLNGVFIGEFGARALIAGSQSVPTLFLAGDDKACLEARMAIPEIETAAIKFGTGREAARHLSPEVACATIRANAARAITRREEIPPFTSLQPPFEFEARYYHPFTPEDLREIEERIPHWAQIDPQTYRVETKNLLDLPF